MQSSNNPQETTNLTEINANDIMKKRDSLIKFIQHLIWKLEFERGHSGIKDLENFANMFPLVGSVMKAKMWVLGFYNLREEWEKINVKSGIKNDDMYQVLKIAMLALKEHNPQLLITAKSLHPAYDHVSTLFGGELPFNGSGYISFAKTMGTVTNQPGFWVNQLVNEAETLLLTLAKMSANNNVAVAYAAVENDNDVIASQSPKLMR